MTVYSGKRVYLHKYLLAVRIKRHKTIGEDKQIKIG